MNIFSSSPLSKENTTLAEMLRAATGQKDTSHNLYFLDFNNLQPNSDSNVRVRLFNDFWGGTTPVLKPIRTYKGTK